MLQILAPSLLRERAGMLRGFHTLSGKLRDARMELLTYRPAPKHYHKKRRPKDPGSFSI